ncbi:hypothetical protein Bca4012_087833 [Brassica carinata]
MYRSGDHRDLEYRSREITPYSPREGRKVLEKSQPTAAFHERIDRHGNSFGARVETKQTRKGLNEWRVKTTRVPLATEETGPTAFTAAHNSAGSNIQHQDALTLTSGQTEEQIVQELNEVTLQYLNSPDPTEAAARRQRVLAGDAKGLIEETAARLMKLQGGHISEGMGNSQSGQNLIPQSKEQIMQDLHEVTKQYLSCVNPVEAAARRQRVLASCAEGLMETNVNSILAVSAEQRRPLSPWERGIRSESPPGIDFDTAMQPSDVEITPPPKEMNREAQLQDPEGLQIQTDIGTEEVTPTRLKSIIVSPKEGNEVEQEIIGNSMEVADDEETLRKEQALKKGNCLRFIPHQVMGGSGGMEKYLNAR